MNAVTEGMGVAVIPVVSYSFERLYASLNRA
jgi:hypothetical protein